MDFRKFDSWIKVPPRTYKVYKDRTGEWDALEQSYHSHVKDIYVHKNEEEDPYVVSRIGIVFVEFIGPLDVWRVSYAATPPGGILSNEYIEERDDEEDSCCNFIANDQRVLGYFTDQAESFEACDEAAVEIAGEVDDALRYNRPSVYFSTYFLTSNYWPFGGERPENDTGGYYEFTYADKDDLPDTEPENQRKEQSNMTFLEAMEAIASGKDPETLCEDWCVEDYLGDLFYKEVADRIDYVECCDVKETRGNDSDILLFSPYRFDKEFEKAHEKTLKELTAKKENCLNILAALPKCNLTETVDEYDQEKPCDEQARANLVAAFDDYEWGGVLQKIYARLGESCFV